MTDEPGQDPANDAEVCCNTNSAAPGIFDEMEEAPATPRPHWRPFIESLRNMARTSWRRAGKMAGASFASTVWTYNVYGDPKGMDARGELISCRCSSQRRNGPRIEAGLVQRSHLLNLILADIYGGSQRLLRDGFLPTRTGLMQIQGFCAPAADPRHPLRFICICSRAIWGVPPMVSGGCCLTARQARAGPGTPGKTDRWFHEFFRRKSVTATLTRWAAFFAGQREMLFRFWRRPDATSPALSCSRPGRTTKAISKCLPLRGISDFHSSKAADLTVRDRGSS